MKAVALTFALLLALVSFAQEKTPATSNACEGKARPETKLTPKQTRDAIVDRSQLPTPTEAKDRACVVLDTFIAGDGTVECVTPLHGDAALSSSVIPEVEKWKFKAIGKRRDGTLQLCWHNGWEVGNEFSSKK
jgi:hypothetical protein